MSLHAPHTTLDQFAVLESGFANVIPRLIMLTCFRIWIFTYLDLSYQDRLRPPHMNRGHTSTF